MIVASMCTIPVRKETFKQIAQRILNEQTQPVDQLHVWLNGYQSIESDLPIDTRLHYHLAPDNPGPGARYLVAELINNEDIVLTLDDDLIYPVNYVAKGVNAVNKCEKNQSLCYGGVLWDWIVPIESLDYHAHKRLISYHKCLKFDISVPVLMGGVAFHRANILKQVFSQELAGFTTNDDLMVSFNLQKKGYCVVSAAKPEGWIQESVVQNAEHALWRRDVSTRVATFKAMVQDHGFVPWCIDKFALQQMPACLIVALEPIDAETLTRVRTLCPVGYDLHTLEIVAGSLGTVSARTLRSHREHFASIPAPGGRLEFLPPVRLWRNWRLQASGWHTIEQYLTWLKDSLNLQKFVILNQDGPEWISQHLLVWAQRWQSVTKREIQLITVPHHTLYV